MYFKKLLAGIFSLLSMITINAQKTEIKYLSGTDASCSLKWDFFCTDGRNSGQWTKIDVPSNWELEGFGTYNYGHDWRNEEIELGKEHGLYRYEFDVPGEWKAKTINIVFDGSMTDTEVKINGKPAGEIHQGAFYRFKYDISKLLKYDTANLLEVDVAKHSSNESVNKAEREADFWIFGGIFRPVFLEVLPQIHINRAAINAKADGSFNILVEVNNSKSDYTIFVDLFELKGNKIGETVFAKIEKDVSSKMISGKFDRVKSWNPEWPNLYNMKITLKKGNETLHQLTERIGFRTVELREHDGFYINGEKVVFKGVNRHSFWPETGRALSEANHLQDIRLMKEMNMNAVRCSHYVPDKRFLELCDSLGLFVLDEVTGWQDGYDTIVGPKLIKETVLRDENHPSVVIWDHGNEGGWDFANEKWLSFWDIQDRPVLCPWLLHNGVDTHHYPEFDYSIGRFVFGNDPFMPTEFLHGLYDGGHGAGLEELWRSYQSSPLLAGAFLWAFADEAVLRKDKPGTVFDADGNHAPDGILGPHREKEGSFYTVKEIWSPIQVQPVTINRKWSRKLFLRNEFIYTNLKDCAFSWKALKTEIGHPVQIVNGFGSVTSPEAFPGETAMILINCEEALKTADIFQFTALDPHGNELYTWSWPVVQPEDLADEFLRRIEPVNSEILILESRDEVVATAAGVEISFSKKDGRLISVKNHKGNVSFSGGPVSVGLQSEPIETAWKKDEAGNFMFKIASKGYPEKVIWKLLRNGLLYLEASPLRRENELNFVGLTFNYPEENCKAVKWMGRGPYRVWKNRMKGSNIGVWEKEYNNTITGESFNKLIYPEFKGYHGNLFWAILETTESDFTVISETPNLYFRLFTPGKPQYVAGGTYPPFPNGDISFLYEIPGIGTKFKIEDQLGYKSQKGTFSSHSGDDLYPIKLWFDFREYNKNMK